MPHKNSEKLKAYQREYRKKYRAEHGERLNREKREHYAKYLAHPRVLMAPEQRRENLLASYRKANAKRKEVLKQYRQDNKERLSAYGKEYYTKNKERVQEWHAKYREENKEKIAQRIKKWQETNKERVLELRRKWHSENKEHKAAYNKTYAPRWAHRRKNQLSYAKQTIKRGTALRNKDIPKELAEAKLLQLMITRETKNEKRK